VIETYEERMAKPRRMLLLCSYCGGDTVQCTDDHPCADCLVMCNTYMIPREALENAEYAGNLPGIVPSRPQGHGSRRPRSMERQIMTPINTQVGDQCLGSSPDGDTHRDAERAVVARMVARFLSWRLPADFNPDNGISFKPTFNDHMDPPMRCNPTGTNLFDRTQAEAMVRHMLDLPT